MKLIFIYGPPAVGKLTVAEKLSELSGIPLFHNHLSRDLVKDIYGDKLSTHYDLVTDIRLTVLNYCSRNDTDLIFTYVYEGSDDNDNVKSLMDSIISNGGNIKFFELTATPEDLLDRVSNDSRKRFKKIYDPEVLKSIIKDSDKFSIPFVEKTIINTSEHTAEESAKLIYDSLN